MQKHIVGQRVKRCEIKATVVAIYSRPSITYGDGCRLPAYPELYAIRFDSGQVVAGYLRHGLEPI